MLWGQAKMSSRTKNASQVHTHTHIQQQGWPPRCITVFSKGGRSSIGLTNTLALWRPLRSGALCCQSVKGWKRDRERRRERGRAPRCVWTEKPGMETLKDQSCPPAVHQSSCLTEFQVYSTAGACHAFTHFLKCISCLSWLSREI